MEYSFQISKFAKEREPFIFQAFPQLKKIPFIALGKFPSPVERMSNLGEVTGVPYLWIKRDDKNGTLFAGNKVRQLEFFLAEALQKGKSHLITMGGIGSNHILSTAVWGKEFGIKVTAIAFDQLMTEIVKRNLEMDKYYGVEMIKAPHYLIVPFYILREYLKIWLKTGKKPMICPPGGTSVLSVLGHIDAALELKNQIEEERLPTPDFLYVPVGTMGTAAGLILGLEIAGLHTRVVGVRVVDVALANVFRLKRLINKTLRLLRICGLEELPKTYDKPLVLLHDFFGERYGKSTPQADKAIQMVWESERIRLDGTYSGKAFAGMLNFIRQNDLYHKVHLFWNTFDPRIFKDGKLIEA